MRKSILRLKKKMQCKYLVAKINFENEYFGPYRCEKS